MKRRPYTSWTMKYCREMGRYVWPVERINPWQIIAERNLLRILRDAVLESNPDILVMAKDAKEKEFYGAGLKEDCFGFMDILAIDPIEGPIAIQSTGPSGHSAHRKTILQNDYAARWVNFEKIELISWRKLVKEKGKKRKIWTPRIEILTKEMFIESAEQMKMFEELE